jgi:hypothetical protein
MLNYEYILEYNELSTTRKVSNTLKSVTKPARAISNYRWKIALLQL